MAGLGQSLVRSMAAVFLLTTVSVHAGESLPEAGAVLKLPTPAGHVVADVVGGKPLQIAPVAEVGGFATDGVRKNNELADFSTPRFESRPAWKLRGWLAPEEFVAGREETGLATDTWSIDSWRLDAAVIRTF